MEFELSEEQLMIQKAAPPQILDELEAEMDKKTAAIFSKMATMPSELVAFIHSNT